MNYIEQLQYVIGELYQVRSAHHHSVPVKLYDQGQTLWEGTVEVFTLQGHSEASLAYAWSYATDDPDNPITSVAVLHIPPVDSPEAAGWVAYASWLKNLPADLVVAHPISLRRRSDPHPELRRRSRLRLIRKRLRHLMFINSSNDGPNSNQTRGRLLRQVNSKQGIVRRSRRRRLFLLRWCWSGWNGSGWSESGWYGSGWNGSGWIGSGWKESLLLVQPEAVVRWHRTDPKMY